MMNIRILQQRWFERTLRTRIPFRYGIATMTEVPHVWLDLEAEIDGQVVRGWAADHLPPKWFTKDPARSLDGEIADMRAVLRSAGERAAGARGGSVDAVMREVRAAQADWAREAGHPPLLANFGVTFVERALIDAAARRTGLTLHELLRGNVVGIELGEWHPELKGMTPADGLPAAPLATAWARHTVGLGDPLEEADVGAEEDPRDGLPVSLAAAIRAYGLKHFKIKVAAGQAGALERLAATVRVIGRETGGNFAASLDGNETFADLAALREFWSRARAEKALAALWPRMLFVEQPVARGQALAERVAADLAVWPDAPPILIDESGADPEDTRRALALGYAGVSHKNCKGVLQGVANACLLARRRVERPDGRWLMSGEDLANVGPIALTQDLAAQAALGNASIERNGHHYFAGLRGWPAATGRYAAEVFNDLYQPDGDSGATLRIDEGRLALGTVNREAFGGRRIPVMGDEAVLWAEF